MSQKGYSPIIVSILIFITLLSVWVLIYKSKTFSLNLNQNTQRACTLEAKICPDGSSVGRSGPNCEFTECLTASSEANEIGHWKVYKDDKRGFSFEYPPNWKPAERIEGEEAALLVTSEDYQYEESEVLSVTHGLGLFYIDQKKTDVTLKEIQEGDQRAFDFNAFFSSDLNVQRAFKMSSIKSMVLDGHPAVLQDRGNGGGGIYAMTIIASQPYLFQMDYGYKDNKTAAKAEQALRSILSSISFE